MGGGPREELSILRTLHYLKELRCPNPRRGEGSEEWKRKQGGYDKTPDIVAGHLIGSGDPKDFFIDVVRPTGDAYFREKAGAPKAARLIQRALRRKQQKKTTRFTLADLGDTSKAHLDALNKKLASYSNSRSGSPMLGVAIYYDLQEGQYGGPVLAYVDSLRIIDAAFGISHHLGAEKFDQVVGMVFDPFGPPLTVVGLPLDVQLAFILWIADKVSAPSKLLLIVNEGVVHPEFEFRGHGVIKWLRRLVGTPEPLLVLGQDD